MILNLLVPIYTLGWRDSLREISVLSKNTTQTARSGDDSANHGICGRRGGLMVSALDSGVISWCRHYSGASGLGLSVLDENIVLCSWTSHITPGRPMLLKPG